MGEYNLTYFEAIEKCLNNEGFIRGENFMKGIYIKNKYDTLIFVNGNGKIDREVDAVSIVKASFKQKYKLFTKIDNKKIGIED